MHTQPSHKPLHAAFPAVTLRALSSVCCVAALVVSAATARATPSVDFSSTLVGPTAFPEVDAKTQTGAHQVTIRTLGRSDVYVVTNTVAPGGHSGWHTHPGPSLVSVKSGTATFYDGDDRTCTPHVVKAGDGFVDHGGDHIHFIRNEGTVELVLVAVQIIPAGAPRRIDTGRSGNCPF